MNNMEQKTYKAIRSGSARGVSGAERDRGEIVHLIISDREPAWQKSLCGIWPRGNGWYYNEKEDKDVTCKRCIEKQKKINGL